MDAALMDPTILIFIGILVFTSGLVVGYITGWDHAVAKAYTTGWSDAMREVRRLIARTKGAA